MKNFVSIIYVIVVNGNIVSSRSYRILATRDYQLEGGFFLASCYGASQTRIKREKTTPIRPPKLRVAHSIGSIFRKYRRFNIQLATKIGNLISLMDNLHVVRP